MTKNKVWENNRDIDEDSKKILFALRKTRIIINCKVSNCFLLFLSSSRVYKNVCQTKALNTQPWAWL